MISREVERQFEVITSRAAGIVPEDELRERLQSSIETDTPLRVKYGIDPTSPNVHIGHMVPCRIIRAFQDLGHRAVLIVGDYTARIGDPTGRNAERIPLSQDKIEENMAKYADQLFRVINKDSAELHYQSSWLADRKLDDLFSLLSRFSVAQMMAHETFRARLDQGARLSLHELVYPVLQAYDSIQVRADVEIGGTDQLFNCLCGRDLQRSLGQRPQIVISAPLLLGPDGRKMSKSFGNHISMNLEGRDIVGKVMSIPDKLLPQYVTLTTDWDDEKRRKALRDFDGGLIHPRDLKLAVAGNVAAQLVGDGAAKEAVDEFTGVFSRKERPSRVPCFNLGREKLSIIDALIATGLIGSKSEGRRLIAQGGVRVDTKKVLSHEECIDLREGGTRLLQVGKRRYAEIRV